jgi:hypothetical protein
VQLVLEMKQLLHLAFHQPRHRHPGPAAHHLGDIFLVHFFLDQLRLVLLFGELLVLLGQLLLQAHQLAVLQFRRAIEIVLPLRLRDLHLGLLHLFAYRPQALHRVLFALPLRHQRVGFRLEIRQLLFEFRQPLFRRLVFLLLQRLALDFELHDAPPRLVQFRRHGVDLRAQPRARFVHQIDRLIRQEPVRDVAVGKYRRRHQRRILNAHAVV